MILQNAREPEIFAQLARFGVDIAPNSTQTIREYIESERNIEQRPKKCKALFTELHQYRPEEMYKLLIANVQNAVSRAQTLNICDINATNFPIEVCTNLHILVEKLIPDEEE